MSSAVSGGELGKYELLRRIASGGMAEIYLARVRGIEGFEKLVVIKRILPHMATDERFVQMFLDEARLAATLHHPNIAQVYDIGVAGENYFFAMELVHGENLRAICKRLREPREMLPLEHSLAITKDVALALDYAHNKRSESGEPLGIVHRDVSPANIMVSYDGAVKLVDFGIARAAQRSTETRTGALKGKVRYMSPEQCRGTPVDLRSDLFSLGVVLYQITTGSRPFDGENDMRIIRAIVEDSIMPPTQLVSGYPPQLEHIVMRMLERDPARRYRSAEEVVVDLETFASEAKLTASAIGLRKFMREKFRDKAESWETARADGVSLAEHIAATITGESVTTAAPTGAEPSDSLRPVVIAEQHRPARWWTAVAAGVGLAVGVGLTLAVALRDGEPAAAPSAASGAAETAQPAVKTAPSPDAQPEVTEPDVAPDELPAAGDSKGRVAAGKDDPEATDDAAGDANEQTKAADAAEVASDESERAVRRRKTRRKSPRRVRRPRPAPETDEPKKSERKKWDRDSPVLPE